MDRNGLTFIKLLGRLGFANADALVDLGVRLKRMGEAVKLVISVVRSEAKQTNKIVPRVILRNIRSYERMRVIC